MAVQDKSDLSERELEILRLLATGVSNKEIAQKLVISPNTVKVHLRNIFSKIGAVSRTEAAMYAVRIGLVPSGQESTEDQGDLERSRLDPLAIATTTITLDRPSFMDRFRQRRLFLITSSIFLLGLAAFFILLYIQPDPGSSSTVNSLEANSLPAESRWKKLAAMSTARTGLAAAVFENRIYAMGGEGNEVTGVVEMYDAINDTWTQLHPLPVPVSDFQVVVIGGKFYAPGGKTSTGLPTDQLQIYDPNKDLWSSGSPMPMKISGYALVTFEGKMFLFGGWDGANYLDSSFWYDPVIDRWEELGKLPHVRAFMGATVIGNKVYILGGYDGKNILKTIDTLVLTTDFTRQFEWEISHEMPGARRGLEAVSLAEIGYIIGGTSDENNGSYAVGWQFLPQSMEWGSFEELPIHSWSRMAVVGLGTYIHILGGEVDAKITAQHLAYQALNVVFLPLLK